MLQITNQFFQKLRRGNHLAIGKDKQILQSIYISSEGQEMALQR